MITRTNFSGCEVTATPAISWDAVALAVMLNVAPADLAEALTRDKSVYRHANDPTPLRVFAGLTETTARAIRAKADLIVGLGTAGESPPSSVRDMARVKRAAERARDRMAAEINAARRDPYQRAADDEAIRRAQAAKAAETYAHRREVEALMRPGGRHG